MNHLSRQRFIQTIGVLMLSEVLASKDLKTLESLSQLFPNKDKNASDLENLLYAYAASSELWENAPATRKALYTMANVYEQRMLPARNYSKREIALENLLSESKENPQLSPEIYARFPDFLGGGTGVEKAFGSSLKIGGILSRFTVLSGPAGAAISVAGVLAEPLLQYLSQPGLNLSVSFLPPTPPAQMDLLNKIMFQRGAELAEEDNTFNRMLSNEVVKINLGTNTDVNDSFEKKSEKLPKNVRDSVLKASAQKSRNLSDEQKKEITDVLKAELKKQWELTNGIQMELYHQNLLKLDELAKQKTRQEFEYASKEMTGLIQIGGFIIGPIFGDKKGAAFFTTCAAAFQQIHESVWKYINNEMGALACGGGIVMGVMSILNIGQPSDTELILESLSKIRDLVIEVGKAVNIILQGEAIIFKQISWGFDLMQKDFNEMRARFSTIQHDILQLSKSTINIQYDSKYHDFRGKINELSSLIENSSQDKVHSNEYLLNYQKGITSLYNYSTETSKEFSFAGDFTLINSFEDISSVIKTRPHADLLFGILEKICAIAEVGVKYPKNIKLPEGSVPNPIAWIHGTLGYLEARTLEPKITLNSERQQLLSLWSEGIRLKEITRISTQKKTLDFFISKYQLLVSTQSNPGNALPDLVNVLINEFDKKNLSNHRIDTLPPGWAVDGSTYYHTKPNKTTIGKNGLFRNILQRDEALKFYKVNEDPLDICLKNEVVEKVLVSSNQWSIPNANPSIGFQINIYQLLIKQGPEKGNFVLGKDSRLCEVSSFRGGNFTGLSRNWNPVDTNLVHLSIGNVGGDPVPLLDECQRLNRWSQDLKTIKAQLPTFLEKEITALDISGPNGSTSIIKKLEGIGSILKLFLTIKQWRSSTLPTIENFELAPYVTYIENTSGIISKESMVSSLAAVIDTLEWKNSTSYSTEIGNHFSEELKKTIEHFNALASDLPDNKGIYEIDETLKRLAGYMKIHKIEFELPE